MPTWLPKYVLNKNIDRVMQKWGRSWGLRPRQSNKRKLTVRKMIVFPRKEYCLSKIWLYNTKWSALKTSIHVKITQNEWVTFGRYLNVYTYIQIDNYKRDHKFEKQTGIHGKNLREEKEGSKWCNYSIISKMKKVIKRIK